MHQMIDLCPYLPTERLTIERMSARPRHSASILLMAVEAVVTAVIGISMLVGITAFLLML